MKFIPFTVFAALLAGCAAPSWTEQTADEDSLASALAGGLSGGLLEYALTGDAGAIAGSLAGEMAAHYVQQEGTLPRAAQSVIGALSE